MNKTDIRGFLILLCLVLPILIVIISFSKRVSLSPEESCRRYVLGRIDKIEEHLFNSKYIAEQSLGKQQLKQIKKEFAKAQKAYKQIEFFVSYYSSFEPANFQIFEENISSEDQIVPVTMSKDLDILIGKFDSLKHYYKTIVIKRPNYEEALSLEISRIALLPLNEDEPCNSKTAVNGYIHRLISFRTNIENFQTVASIQQKREIKTLVHRLNSTIVYLDEHPDQVYIDQTQFKTIFLEPLYNSTCDLFDSFHTSSISK